MKRILLLAILIPTLSNASDLTFGFKSPAFTGMGYSSHVLTIEQLETNRKQKIKDDFPFFTLNKNIVGESYNSKIDKISKYLKNNKNYFKIRYA